MIVALHVVDYGVQEENSFFGTIVARSDVRGMSERDILIERLYLRHVYGIYVSIIEVEEIPAVA